MASISVGGIGAIQGANHTEKSQQALKEVFRELANNLGANHVTDSADRLAVAERFNAEVQGVNQATLNVNDGIAIIQVADAGLQQIQEGQQRLNELAVQSANGTLTDGDRKAIQLEVTHIEDQIKSIISNTEYNDIKLLSSSEKIHLQTGPNAGDQTAIQLTDFSKSHPPLDLSTQSASEVALVNLMSDMAQVSSGRAELGAAESNLYGSASRLNALSQALSVAGSSIHDVDIATQSTRLVTANIRARASLAIQAQANLSSARVQQLVQ
ncbi:MAG: hypothetical protein HQL72_05105 [Magnetococcales bacterium]|nr:hypothetical protein [Magnetococcales bacterium]